MDDEQRDQILINLDRKTREIHQGLYGVPNTSDNGLFGIVRNHGTELFKLKRNFWLLVGLLVGGGTLAGSAIATFGG